MTRRLDRLLKIRRAGETRERGRWDRARQDHAELANDAGAKAARADDAAEHVRALGRGELNLSQLKIAGEGREALRLGCEKAEAAARDAERHAEARRGELERAHWDVRAIEKLSERAALETKAKLIAAESRETDDRPRAERP